MRLSNLFACALALAGFATAMPSSSFAQETREVELKHDGLTLLGDLVMPDDGSLSDGAVLLLHGTLAHKDMELIETLQVALAERGVASLAPTLSHAIDSRRGMYDCGTPHRYRYEDAQNELAAWIDWLKSEGTGPVTLMGHSRGGNQVAWFAAAAAGDGVAKAVLLAPAMWTGPEAVEANYAKRYGAQLSPVMGEAEKLLAAGKGDQLLSVPGFIYCGKTEVAAVSFVSNYAVEPRRDTAGLVRKIKMPVLVIAGSLDEVVPQVPAQIGPIADGEKIRLEVVEDADHFFLDFYAEDAADLVVEFVTE
ncbi:alpha/beta hydrolase [Pelagibius sp. Alg239-R121]|uniref:alpha/beta hydrolase n=1 Tax=Pelagibius sp. Alg239-R121 TaxID=2993448 RepID=UPI0024A68DFA|nr:alpha/beta hydrolase [Pelagibius sp. Alg239-R121]